MGKENQEYSFKLRAKLLIYFLFAFVGIPMLYAAYLNFEIGETMTGILTLGLFLSWVMVIFAIAIYKIQITDSSIRQVKFFTSKDLSFSEIEFIHFGSTFSSFYIQTGNSKLHLSKDLKHYEDIIHQVLDRIKSVKNIKEVEFSGKQELIEQYNGESAI